MIRATIITVRKIWARLPHAAVLLGLLVLGCAPAPYRPLASPSVAASPTPRPISLPSDNAPHNDLTEWWYYTGHLKAANGHQYGFEFVIFQAEREAAPIVYAAHFAITDHQRQQFHYAQQLWTTAQKPSQFDLGKNGWHMSETGRVDDLTAAMPGYSIDLHLTPEKPPTLNGKDGIISFGPVGESYYYSDTRLAVSGTLVDHGSPAAVNGLAWKDHQWGNFLVLPGGGWDWVSVQLSDGADLMLFHLRGTMGQVTPAYGTYIPAEGAPQSLRAGAATLKATGSWTSPHTHITYPSGWLVTIPNEKLSLSLQPVLKDQELDTRATTGQIYWEGEVTVQGTHGGRPVAGLGYVELTGYEAPTSPAR